MRVPTYMRTTAYYIDHFEFRLHRMHGTLRVPIFTLYIIIHVTANKGFRGKRVQNTV